MPDDAPVTSTVVGRGVKVLWVMGWSLLNGHTGIAQALHQHLAQAAHGGEQAAVRRPPGNCVELQRQRQRRLAQHFGGGAVAGVTLVRHDTAHLLAAGAGAHPLAAKRTAVHAGLGRARARRRRQALGQRREPAPNAAPVADSAAAALSVVAATAAIGPRPRRKYSWYEKSWAIVQQRSAAPHHTGIDGRHHEGAQPRVKIGIMARPFGVGMVGRIAPARVPGGLSKNGSAIASDWPDGQHVEQRGQRAAIEAAPHAECHF